VQIKLNWSRGLCADTLGCIYGMILWLDLALDP